MSVKDRVSPANLIIAEFLGTDIESVTEMVYQPTIYRAPRIYSWDDNPWSYFCCPRKGQKLPKGFKWEIAGYSWRKDAADRPVYGVRYDNIEID